MEPAGDKAAFPAAAIAALQAGDKIGAIKIVRQERGTDLKDSKDIVEAYVRSQPALQAEVDAANKRTHGKLLNWLALLVLGAVLAYFFLKR